MLYYNDPIYDFGDWLKAGKPKNRFVSISAPYAKETHLSTAELREAIKSDVITFARMASKRIKTYGGTPVRYVYDPKVNTGGEPLGEYRGVPVWLRWLNEGDEVPLFYYRLVTYMEVIC